MQTNKNSIVKAWLYEMLAKVEMDEVKDANKKVCGNKITIEIELDY